MSRSANQKSNATARKTPLIIIGVLVCFASMFTINEPPSMTSMQNVNALREKAQVTAQSIAIDKPGQSVKIHEKSSKPHYDFLSYYFMVESDRKKPSERTFQENHSIAGRLATLPKLLFNSFFDQN